MKSPNIFQSTDSRTQL